MSTLDQIKQLEEQKQALIEQAKKEAFAIIDEQVKALAEFGVYIEITERTSPKRRRRRKKSD